MPDLHVEMLRNPDTPLRLFNVQIRQTEVKGTQLFRNHCYVSENKEFWIWKNLTLLGEAV